MNRKYRLSTALDIDDLLMECTSYAIRLANEKYEFDPPLSIYEIDRWGKLGTRADAIFEFFDDPDFFRNQPVVEGAKEFVRKLSHIAEVFVATSIKPEFMGIRATRIIQEFPEISPDHIYMGQRKDKIDVDILFDDGMHNIRTSAAKTCLRRDSLGDPDLQPVRVFFDRIKENLGSLPSKVSFIRGNIFPTAGKLPGFTCPYIDFNIVPNRDRLHNTFKIVITVRSLSQNIQGQIQLRICRLK